VVGTRGRTPAVMVAPTVVLLVLGLLVGSPAAVRGRAMAGAQRFVDRPAAVDAVLFGRPRLPPTEPGPSLDAVDWVVGMLAGLGALAVAGGALYPSQVPASVRRTVHALDRPVRVLRAAHSGLVNDYIAWLLFGT